MGLRTLRLCLALLLCAPAFAESTKTPGPQDIPMLNPDGMGKWKLAPYALDGDAHVYEGVLRINIGDYLTGVVWNGEPPARMNYEMELEARRTFGSDFFLGLTVPVGDSHCTWVVGGWGGRIVGISNINGLSADRNETTRKMQFESDRWYRCKIRVANNRIQCWIDAEKVIDLDITGKRISMRPGQIEQSIPLGIATYDTEADYRNIFWRNLGTAPEDSASTPVAGTSKSPAAGTESSRKR